MNMRTGPATCAIAALALTLAGMAAAHAHVTLEKAETGFGAGYKAVFKVPHGCEGSATVEIRIDIPEGVIAVKPMPKPGWTIELVKKPYARSYAFYHGAKLSEGVRQVTWRGGPLPDDFYDEFILSTYLARELEPGPLYFPVTQRCEQGELAWSQIPAADQSPHDLERPAPRLMLVAAPNDPAAHAAPLRAGDLAIAAAWARATPGSATATAGYLDITNMGTEPDVLLGATCDAAERVELHETVTGADGVSTMRPLPEGLSIRSSESVELKPLGRHLMLIGLKAPLDEGQTVVVQLKFKRAGTIAVPLAVMPVGAKAPHPH